MVRFVARMRHRVDAEVSVGRTHRFGRATTARGRLFSPSPFSPAADRRGGEGRRREAAGIRRDGTLGRAARLHRRRAGAGTGEEGEEDARRRKGTERPRGPSLLLPGKRGRFGRVHGKTTARPWRRATARRPGSAPAAAAAPWFILHGRARTRARRERGEEGSARRPGPGSEKTLLAVVVLLSRQTASATTCGR